MWALNRQVFSLIICAILIGTFACCSRSVEKYQVLLIESYDSQYTKASLLEKGVSDYFRKKGVRMNLDISYLDCEIKTADEEIGFLSKLMDSYRGKRLDLIIVCDDQATFSLLKTNHSLANKVPIVFCGVDYFNPDLIKGYDNVTGLILRHDFGQCVDIGKKLFQINKIYYLTDSTFLGQRFKADFEDQMRQKDDSIQVEYLNATSQRSKFLIWKINTAEPNSIIIIPRYDNIYPLYSQKTSVPVFVMSNEAFNADIFYGNIVNDETQTAEAAHIGIEILEGKKPKDIPIALHYQQPTFNWSRLEKWNVDQAALPLGSIVVNIPFFEKYCYYIIVGSVLFLFMLFYLIASYIKEHRQKKQAQRNLIKQRNEFDITLRALYEGVISIDREGKIFGINKKAIELLGLNLSAETYIGQHIHLLLILINTKKRSFCLGESIKTAFENNKPIFFPENTFLSDKESSLMLPVSGEVAPIYKDDTMYGAVIVFRDVSNEYAQRELLALNFNETKVYPWMLDIESQTVSYGNDLFNKGKTPVSLYEVFSKAMHPDDIPVWKKCYDTALGGEIKRGSFQVRMNQEGKGYEWWEFRFSCIPDTPMKPSSKIFGICVNIEATKTKEVELVMARDMAAKAELKQSFLANMSHEIRTPLNAIVGFSNLLVELEELDENEKKEFAYSINKNCEILLKLVNDVLEISRIDSGNMSFKEEECEIIPLLKDLYSNISILIPDTIQFELTLPPSSIRLLCDSLRLTQILMNFLNNALKFTQKGKIILGCALGKDHSVDLYVEDTGKGISEEEQIVIFDRFYKSDEFAQGTGLGLSICKMIAEHMGGVILLKSKLGQGSRFTIRLPYKN